MKLPFINEDIFKPHKSLGFFFWERHKKSSWKKRTLFFIYKIYIYKREGFSNYSNKDKINSRNDNNKYNIIRTLKGRIVAGISWDIYEVPHHNISKA